MLRSRQSEARSQILCKFSTVAVGDLQAILSTSNERLQNHICYHIIYMISSSLNSLFLNEYFPCIWICVGEVSRAKILKS